ncbi:MAG: hypothetical protein WAN36_02835, partial [Calditrichia bacterium]
VTESTEEVSHGITLFVRYGDPVNKRGDYIWKVAVDFYRPVNGSAAALEKASLPNLEPTSRNSGHVLWENGKLVPGLIVDLERREWESDWFSSLQYLLAEPI